MKLNIHYIYRNGFLSIVEPVLLIFKKCMQQFAHIRPLRIDIQLVVALYRVALLQFLQNDCTTPIQG